MRENANSVWIGLELVGLRTKGVKINTLTTRLNALTTLNEPDNLNLAHNLKRFPIESLPEIPDVHPWKMYKTLHDLVNMPDIFPIPSPVGAHIYIDPKLNIFFKTTEESETQIAWSLDEHGRVYIYNCDATTDATLATTKEYVADNLGDFLYRVAIENEIWDSIYTYANYAYENDVDDETLEAEFDDKINLSTFALQYIKELYKTS
jgi:hypothetical protein